MSIVDQLRENQTGMLYDLLFAVVWVAFVSFLFDFVFIDAPSWAFYMFMLAGIPAYFGFFFSLKVAKQQQRE
ncbi:hypothetical protein [Natronolimnobius baerhuensis]|uniref:DUF8119 domain-containing protein n=1 Tax=Natronolimnobius baerhuensis TaxID=253108 RepID=A0A202EBJ6_9EURY|nr:hypothetical protein [Natronolimnobius baerhuensis]OVE85612.1 hypothetical protein B2G88_01950 [Natronolimnobius baerhuensis]